MFEWIAGNIGTILICLVLIAVVAAIICGLIRDKKRVRAPAAQAVRIVPCPALAARNNKPREGAHGCASLSFIRR